MILQGDALHLPLRDASVDAILCDPPYADQLTMFGTTLATVTHHAGLTVEESILSWTQEWAQEAHRVLRPGGSMLVFSSAKTFHFLVTEVPPVLLGVFADGDMAWHFAPSPYAGGLEMAGFRFQHLHKWVYGTGRPRNGIKPAWEAIVEVRKAPPARICVQRVNLLPVLRDLLPQLDPARRAEAERILADPAYDQRQLLDHPAFMGAFDDALQIPMTMLDRPIEPLPEPGQWFYVPKPSVAEQDGRLAGRVPATRKRTFGLSKRVRYNDHPTPKPVKLMRQLLALACPHGGTVLDMFAGSGSTGEACAIEGNIRFIGVERERRFAELAYLRSAPLVHTVEPEPRPSRARRRVPLHDVRTTRTRRARRPRHS